MFYSAEKNILKNKWSPLEEWLKSLDKIADQLIHKKVLWDDFPSDCEQKEDFYLFSEWRSMQRIKFP